MPFYAQLPLGLLPGFALQQSGQPSGCFRVLPLWTHTPGSCPVLPLGSDTGALLSAISPAQETCWEVGQRGLYSHFVPKEHREGCSCSLKIRNIYR